MLVQQLEKWLEGGFTRFRDSDVATHVPLYEPCSRGGLCDRCRAVFNSAAYFLLQCENYMRHFSQATRQYSGVLTSIIQ